MKYKIISGKNKGEVLELEEVKEATKSYIKEQTLEWGESSKEEMTWEEAKEWCKSQGNGWRLPTVQELVSAYDYEKEESKIGGFIANTYWSSVTVPSGSTWAYFVYMNGGYVNSNYKTNTSYVRCVK